MLVPQGPGRVARAAAVAGAAKPAHCCRLGLCDHGGPTLLFSKETKKNVKLGLKNVKYTTEFYYHSLHVFLSNCFPPTHISQEQTVG